MLDIHASNNLFVELSTTEEEMITGGGSVSNIQDDISSFYESETSFVNQSSLQSTGPGGSLNTQTFNQDYQQISNGAYQGIGYIFI